MAVLLGLRRIARVPTLVAMAAVLGLVVATAFTGWHEAMRLIGYRPTYTWNVILRVADLPTVIACALGLLITGTGLHVLLRKPVRASKLEPVTRAKTDTFGHADWMPMSDAAALFDASREPRGGVVVGEAYRGDQDPGTAHRSFDPRDRTTWGKGGTAPLLTCLGTRRDM